MGGPNVCNIYCKLSTGIRALRRLENGTESMLESFPNVLAKPGVQYRCSHLWAFELVDDYTDRSEGTLGDTCGNSLGSGKVLKCLGEIARL
jgi:hypothetical protein